MFRSRTDRHSTTGVPASSARSQPPLSPPPPTTSLLGRSATVTTTTTTPSTRRAPSGGGDALGNLAGLSLNDDLAASSTTPPPPPYQPWAAPGGRVTAPDAAAPRRAASSSSASSSSVQMMTPRSPLNDPPSAAPSSTVTPTQRDVRRRNSVEDPMSTLSRYDVVIVVDDSPSMVDHWDETRDALLGVVEKAAKYDRDGLDLYWLNEPTVMRGVTSATEVREMFETVVPSGSTPTGFVLDDIMRPYVESVEDAKAARGAERVKPLVVIVLTDGRADDPEQVRDLVVEMAQRLDDVRAPPHQCGISFIQVGDDEDAAAFLQELDDDLKSTEGVRDMVDTLPYKSRLTAEFLLKATLGSVVKNLDRQSAS